MTISIPHRCSLLLFLLCHGLTISARTEAQNDNIRKVGCQLASVYQRPNASASFSIPAIDITEITDPGAKPNVTLKVSPSNQWSFTNILGQSQDVYAPDRHNILEQAMFLDTSSTIKNSTKVETTGLAGCAFFFSLPNSDLGKGDDGTCTTVLDRDCVTDFTSKADAASMRVSNGSLGANLANMDACGRIADALTDLPGSCKKFGSGKSLGKGLVAYSPIDFSPPSSPSSYNCSGTDFSLNNDTSIPTNVFAQSTPLQNTTNFTLYDQWARTVTPILLTFFSNKTATTANTEPFSANRLVCSSPRNVLGSSRVPKSAAETTVGTVSVVKLVLGGLMINAIVFLFL